METKENHPLKSRKLAIAIGVILTTLATAFAGQIEWGVAIQTTLEMGFAYVAGQGIVDLAGKMAPVLEAWKTKNE